MINNSLKGVGVALVTPFNEDKSIDYGSLTKLVDHVSLSGADYLVVMGTTAENPTISYDEQKSVLKHIIASNKANLPIVLGVGGNDTQQVVERLKEIDTTGVSAILSVTPYYNKPNQNGLFAHFCEIAKASPLPIILYNVPGRTGINMTPHTTLRLVHEYPSKFIGIKEASGNLSQVAMLLRDAPSNFLIISGDDNLTLATIAMGGHGVISVSANCYSETFCRMVHCAMEGDYNTASTLNLKLHEATDLLFEQGNPVGVKAALAIKGIIRNNLRLPLVPASDELILRIKHHIQTYGL